MLVLERPRPRLALRVGTGSSVALLVGACLALALIPVLAVTYPPLTDYPNHMARAYILLNLPHSLVLQRYYRDVMQAQPNLAMDLVIPPLAHLVPIWTAGRVFAALTILSMAGGCTVLHRALHGRWSGWPVLALLFAYNRLFLWGFLGYLFALGAALAAAGGWYALRERPVARLGFGIAAATILYLLHLYGLGIYAVIAGGFELAAPTGARGLRRLVVFGLQFVPAAWLFLFVSPTSAAAGRTHWSGIISKMTAPLTILADYHPWLDIGMLAGVLAVCVALRARIRFAGVAAIPLSLLAVIALAMPDELFSSYGADRRIPIAFILLAIAATDCRGIGTRLQTWLAGGFVLLLGFRVLLIWQVWQAGQPVYRQFIEAYAKLPEGAVLVSAMPGTGRALPRTPLYHVDAYAVILRDAFLPSLFAAPWDAGSSLGFTPRYAALRAETPMVALWPPMLARLRDPGFAARHGPFRQALRARYGYGLVIDGEELPAAARPPASCAVVGSGRDFQLLRFPCPATGAGPSGGGGSR